MRPARTSRRGTARAATRHIDPSARGYFRDATRALSNEENVLAIRFVVSGGSADARRAAAGRRTGARRTAARRQKGDPHQLLPAAAAAGRGAGLRDEGQRRAAVGRPGGRDRLAAQPRHRDLALHPGREPPRHPAGARRLRPQRDHHRHRRQHQAERADGLRRLAVAGSDPPDRLSAHPRPAAPSRWRGTTCGRRATAWRRPSRRPTPRA